MKTRKHQSQMASAYDEEQPTTDLTFANIASTPKGEEPSRILVRFKSKEIKEKVISSVKKWQKSNKRGLLTTSDIGISGVSHKIFLRDNLTFANQRLLRTVKDKARERNFSFVWVKDCKILVRKSTKSPVFHINSIRDISRFIL